MAKPTAIPAKEKAPDNPADKDKPNKNGKLGEILLEEGKITPVELIEALEKQQDQRIGEILVDEGKVTSEDIVSALSKQLDLPKIDINTFQISKTL